MRTPFYCVKKCLWIKQKPRSIDFSVTFSCHELLLDTRQNMSHKVIIKLKWSIWRSYFNTETIVYTASFLFSFICNVILKISLFNRWNIKYVAAHAPTDHGVSIGKISFFCKPKIDICILLGILLSNPIETHWSNETAHLKERFYNFIVNMLLSL